MIIVQLSINIDIVKGVNLEINESKWLIVEYSMSTDSSVLFHLLFQFECLLYVLSHIRVTVDFLQVSHQVQKLLVVLLSHKTTDRYSVIQVKGK